ncbi:hypothetical protein NMY22_g10176 [Coprinellus aureogranulatus]|nr:hypothetical protein NMY22_g10176 [Coprinellus aureogranulatus]
MPQVVEAKFFNHSGTKGHGSSEWRAVAGHHQFRLGSRSYNPRPDSAQNVILRDGTEAGGTNVISEIMDGTQSRRSEIPQVLLETDRGLNHLNILQPNLHLTIGRLSVERLSLPRRVDPTSRDKMREWSRRTCPACPPSRMGRHQGPLPSTLDLEAQADVERLVSSVLAACANPGELSSSLRVADITHRSLGGPVQLAFTVEEVHRVASSKASHKNAKLRKHFTDPEINDDDLPTVDRATVFIGEEGKIVGWYLPNVFSSRISDRVLNSTQKLSQNANTVLEVNQKSKNWRHEPTTFTHESECTVPPGHVAFSPCWFELGHDISNSLPAPSLSLRREGGGAVEFLADEIDTNALIGALLAIVHPELFEMQVDVMARLKNGEIAVKHDDAMAKVLEYWSSPFTGFALISNRETPFHRDTLGGRLLYDVVATFGRYRGGRFAVPLFGSRFAYGPGTVFVLPGFLFEHGASRVTGDRVCFANFFKPNVGYALSTRYREVAPPTIAHLTERYGIQIAL